eukprot:TRINITY_DN102357_c0_g1_i1.p1 TRINITY_DN102357_c0_g1~~TRINITY_DN102357_c0_g1_i1.p1  ORF type:complete len:611 (-),score=92.54 TRINITY_DN102357_c0_g1_i1:27-1859(-)
MLVYSNRGILRIILTCSASVVWRQASLLPGLVLALLAVLAQYLIQTEHPWAPKIVHHYGIHALGGIVSFAVVFRTNLGWQRYWEGITQLHIMYSKWADAYSQVVAFAKTTMDTAKSKGTEEMNAKYKRVMRLTEVLENHFILMSALAADRLAHGDTTRMDLRADRLGFSKQIALRKDLWQVTLLDSERPLPNFVCSSKAVDSSLSERVEQNLGRPSSQDQIALSKVADNPLDETYVLKKLPEPEEMQILDHSIDRVNVVMYWILQSLTQVSKDLDIAPPIQSRMYQELSNGMLGFSQALKISDCPFPFPYAQLLTVLLVAFSLCIPIYIPVFTQSYIGGFCMGFFVFQGIWGVNEVAKDLENPFGNDENDIPLSDFHARFLELVKDVNEAHRVKMEVFHNLETAEKQSKLRQCDENKAVTAVDAPVAVKEPLAAAAPAAPAPRDANGSAAPPSAEKLGKPGAGPNGHGLLGPLAEIATRMEKHLERIARDLDTGGRIEMNGPKARVQDEFYPVSPEAEIDRAGWGREGYVKGENSADLRDVDFTVLSNAQQSTACGPWCSRTLPPTRAPIRPSRPSNSRGPSTPRGKSNSNREPEQMETGVLHGIFKTNV